MQSCSHRRHSPCQSYALYKIRVSEEWGNVEGEPGVHNSDDCEEPADGEFRQRQNELLRGTTAVESEQSDHRAYACERIAIVMDLNLIFCSS